MLTGNRNAELNDVVRCCADYAVCLSLLLLTENRDTELLTLLYLGDSG